MGERGPSFEPPSQFEKPPSEELSSEEPPPSEKQPPRHGPLRRAAEKAARSAVLAATLSSGCRPAESPVPERAPITETIPPTPEAINRPELLTRLFRDIPEPQEPSFQNLIKFEKGKLARDFKRRLEATAPYMAHAMNIFQEEGVPPQLALLALPESGGATEAVSRRHATGPFQFTAETARDFGLNVNSQIDERRDPFLSSRAAAKLLKDLYRRTGSWEMAILSYNSGMALRFDGSWEKYLQHVAADQYSKHKRTKRSAKESLHYLPRFFATRQLLQGNPEYLNQLAAPASAAQAEYHLSETRPQQTHRIKRGEKLSVIARDLGVTLENLCSWNKIENPQHIQAGRKLVYYTGRPPTPRPSELAAQTGLSREQLAEWNPSWNDAMIAKDEYLPFDFSLTVPTEQADTLSTPAPNSPTPDHTRRYQLASANFLENLRTFLAKKQS